MTGGVSEPENLLADSAKPVPATTTTEAELEILGDEETKWFSVFSTFSSHLEKGLPISDMMTPEMQWFKWVLSRSNMQYYIYISAWLSQEPKCEFEWC